MKAVQWVKKLKVSISRKKYIVVAILASFFCDDSRQGAVFFASVYLEKVVNGLTGQTLGRNN